MICGGRADGSSQHLAIRRGLIGGWRHTLACGIGSVTGDLLLFSVVLLGGHYVSSDLSNPTLQTVLAAIGVLVLLPLGVYFLIRAVKNLCGRTPALANAGTFRTEEKAKRHARRVLGVTDNGDLATRVTIVAVGRNGTPV